MAQSKNIGSMIVDQKILPNGDYGFWVKSGRFDKHPSYIVWSNSEKRWTDSNRGKHYLGVQARAQIAQAFGLS